MMRQIGPLESGGYVNYPENRFQWTALRFLAAEAGQDLSRRFHIGYSPRYLLLTPHRRERDMSCSSANSMTIVIRDGHLRPSRAGYNVYKGRVGKSGDANCRRNRKDAS
ncbi:hypothetical protein [Marinobacter sp. PE14]